MKITQSGKLVKLESNVIKKSLLIDDSIRVQLKGEHLLVNDWLIPLDLQFVSRLDQAIKNYQLALSQWIQMLICGRMQVLKMNQTNDRVVVRYIWISENYSELRYSEQRLSRQFKTIKLVDCNITYLAPNMKLMQKQNLCSELSIAITYGKKRFDIIMPTFHQLHTFINLLNWIFRSRNCAQIKFSSLLYLKQKLLQSAAKAGIPLKKYLYKQLNQIRTRYTLKQLQNQPSPCISHKKKPSFQITLKHDKENNSVVQKLQFT